jgi:hypothetical protein
MIWREQSVPPERAAGLVAFRALPAGTSVRAFAHRLGDTQRLDSEMLGCEEHVVSRDGRLCPSVISPGTELTATQVERLRALTERPIPSARSRCDFEPHHSFVALDPEGSVAAHLRVCFECAEWSVNGEGNVPLPEGAARELAALCRTLNLRGCPHGDDHSDGSAGSRRPSEFRPPGTPSAALVIPPETLLVDLSEEQKRQLCAWRILEDPPLHLSLELDSGHHLRFLDYRQCLTRFPRCAEPLGSIEALDFSSHAIHPDMSTEQVRCLKRAVSSPLARCAWGIEASESAP